MTEFLDSVDSPFTFNPKAFGTGMVRISRVKGFFNSKVRTIGGIINEVNEKTSNSVGVRFNRFILSDEFRLTHPGILISYPNFINKFIKAEFPKKLLRGSNYLIDTKAEIPSVDGVSRTQVLSSAKFSGFDTTKYEPDFQLFFTNLIQRNFMQFSSEGQDNTNFADIGQINDFKQDIPLGTILDGANKGSDFLQSFFHFDVSQGDFALQSGDHVRSAKLKIVVKSHFGERSIPSSSYPSSSSLFGPLRVNPRKFQYAAVSKPYTANYVQGAEGDRFLYNETNGWDSYYGTSGNDIVSDTLKEFTISKPLQKGEVLEFDIKDIVQDAIDNRSSIVRIAMRPKLSIYDRVQQNENLKNGVGNHWFEFYRDPDFPELLPSIDVRITPNKDSTPQRRARFLR